MGDFWLDTTTGHGLVGIDEGGAITSFSASAVRLLGRDPEAALGRSLIDVAVPERFRPRTREEFERVASGRAPELIGRTVRALVLTAAGERPVSVTMLETGPAPTRFAVCLSTDDGYLLRDEAQMDLTGLWVIEAGLQEIDGTERFWDLHGHSGPRRRYPVSDYMADFVHPDDRLALDARRDQRAAGSEVASVVTWRVITPGGDVRTLQSETAAFFGPGGTVERMMGITRDVTGEEGARRTLAAHRAVDEAIRDWDTPRGGAAGLLRRLVTAMDWRAGALWRCDPAADELDCPVVWRPPGDLPGVPSEAEMRLARLSVSSGPPGRAWSTGEVVATGDAESPSAEVAIPVVRAGRPLAVLHFHLASGEVIPDELLGALRDIGRGPVAECVARHRAELGLSPLTDREQQVLQHAADGGSIRLIADELGISPSTVKTHFEHIYDKLGVADRAAAVAEGFRQGLVR